MKHFYLAHYNEHGKPLGKDWQNYTLPEMNVWMKSAEGTVEEIEALQDFSRWPPKKS